MLDSEFAPAPKRRRAEPNAANDLSSPIYFPSILPNLQPAAAASLTVFTRKALYIFSGIKRKASIGDFLASRGWTIVELDILRSKHHDLTRPCNQKKILDRIAAKEFHLVISSPPCDTFTRVKMANKNGPPPTRSRSHPRGWPWVSDKLKLQNRLGNILADFSYSAILKQLVNPAGFNLVIKEHPEDLGVVTSGPYKGKFPASIWQWVEHTGCGRYEHRRTVPK